LKFTDNDQRRVFMGMARPDQLATLWDQDAYLRGELATDKNEHIAMRADLEYVKRELQGIGRRDKDDTLTTTEKFNR